MADSYDSIGVTQREKKDYVSALPSFERALNIKLKLCGEQHATTADSYDSTGVTQHEMKDDVSALQFKQLAINIIKDCKNLIEDEKIKVCVIWYLIYTFIQSFVCW